MATHEVLKLGVNAAGEATREVVEKMDLNDNAVFDAPVKPRLFHEVVKYIQARRRSGNASAKTKGLVRGGGKKPFRQKGTGRARAGSRRSPLWRGGGVIFGPQTRDWSYSINKKLRQNALRAAITARRKEGLLILVDKFDLPEIKTKYFQAILDDLGVTNALIVDVNPGQVLVRSARNIPFVQVSDVSRLNVYDILLHEHLIVTDAAKKALEGALGS